MRRPVRTVLFSCLGALALFGAGCGNKHHVTTEAPTEGLWVDVGALDYHIQGSRQLNEAIPPDDAYLTALPQGVLPPGGRETWFAVFVRVENKTDEAHPTAEEFEILDTDERIYRPLALKKDTNPFAYEPTQLAPKASIPEPDSAAEFNTGGSMLLFKIPLTAYQNRPLELKIIAPEDPNAGDEHDAPEEATLDLDV